MRIMQGTSPGFRISKKVAHRFCGRICLVYLLSFDRPNLSSSESLETYPFLAYSRNWRHHIRMCSIAGGPTPEYNLILKLFDSKFCRSIWLKPDILENVLLHPSSPRPELPFNGLYQCVRLNFQDIFEYLLGKVSDLNAEETREDIHKALFAAVENGREKMVRLLIERDADFNTPDVDRGSILQVAASGGHESLVQLLLERGVDVNDQGGFDGNALEAATMGCFAKLVRLLLERGARPNAKGGGFGTALAAAINYRYESIVRILVIEWGADVNLPGDIIYKNALQAAAHCGSEQMVKLLLEQGARINEVGGFYDTALQAAAGRDAGDLGIVKLLLKSGAEVNTLPGGYYGSALQAASGCGHTAIVQLLLDEGADVNTVGGDFGTALQAASFFGHQAVVQLLLESGAEVNVRGGRYGGALNAAFKCVKNRKVKNEIVRLLLEHGAMKLQEPKWSFIDDFFDTDSDEFSESDVY